MSQSIHGHEVMEMMLEEGGHFTRASLKEAQPQGGDWGALWRRCPLPYLQRERDGCRGADRLAGQTRQVHRVRAGLPDPGRQDLQPRL